MKFSIGDKIVLKRTGEEGHVTGYINQQMLEVEVNGTVFPVYIEEIDHPYLKWFTEKNKQKKQVPSMPEQLPVEKEKFRKPRLALGVYLSFLPVFKIEEMEDIVDYFKVYILNELPVHIRFSYDVRFLNQSEFKHEGILPAFQHIYLHNVLLEDMNDQPRFHWQFSDTNNPDLDIAEGVLRIRPSRLFEHITDVLHKGEPTFSYLLMEDFKPKAKEQQPEKPVITPLSKPLPIEAFKPAESPKSELDLHIESLLDNYKGLSNAEILNIQLDTLKHYLQLAIAHRQQRMTVIHGLGKGKLREEVHKILKQTPHVSRFKNEWHGRYGFGATEVQFRY